MKKKFLLTSVLVILMCVSLIGGATFALFTSEDVVNIAITSGKVEVEAVLGDFYYKTFQNPDWTLAEGNTTNFANIGGSAYVNGDTLVLDKIVPGNGVKVNVEIKNNSDIAIKYMVKTELTGENVDEIVVTTVCDEAIVDAGWLSLDAGADIADLTVSVELPVEATVQGVVANVAISVLAVQGDATVWSGDADDTWADSEEAEYVITTAEELAGFANLVNAGNTFKGKTVKLGDSIDLMGAPWEPIGNSQISFQGTFDGQGNTIYNLFVNKEGKSYVGLFGNTTIGTVKNLNVHNAIVKGRLNVGVVVGNPYTTTYENITVSGLVQVDGMSYVGGVGGKNAYANWTDVTVDVVDGSYVKADSVENGTAYRTYVGGVVGFNGEGGHTFKNITSNIDVYGTVCDIGGIFGIAHYDNQFENIVCTGNVTNLVSSAIDGDDAVIDAQETGLIAGVWMNTKDMYFNNVSATGELIFPNVQGVNVVNGGLVGKGYNSNGDGKLYINGAQSISTVYELQTALDNAVDGDVITLSANITGDVTVTQKEDVKITLDGNGYTYNGAITVDGKSKRYATAGIVIKNVNFDAKGISKDACINLGVGTTATRYTNNVTVLDCTFEGTGNEKVAVKSYTGGDWNLTLSGCTVGSGMHSLAQVTNVETGLKIVDCKVYSKNGINLNNTPSFEMTDCEFDVIGYAIRVGVNGSVNADKKTFNVTDSTLKSVCDDGDAVIIFRDNATNAVLTLTNVSLVGTTEISGNTGATIINK